MIWLAAAICLPTVLVPVLMTLTALPDLSNFTPKTSSYGQDILLDWTDLERGYEALRQGGLSSGAHIRALGYMMMADLPIADGRLVSEFLLLPDAGNAFHPAHRFGDQMIEVHLRRGNTARFSGRNLVWVWGILRALPGNPGGDRPLYHVEDARTLPADRTEISKYFRHRED